MPVPIPSYPQRYYSHWDEFLNERLSRISIFITIQVCKTMALFVHEALVVRSIHALGNAASDPSNSDSVNPSRLSNHPFTRSAHLVKHRRSNAFWAGHFNPTLPHEIKKILLPAVA